MMTESPKKRKSFKQIFFIALYSTILMVAAFNFIDGRPTSHKKHNIKLAEVKEKTSLHPIMDLQGNTRFLGDFIGKPTIIKFWATWCGYCAQDVSKLADFHSQYKDDYNIITISDIEDTPTGIETFYQKFNGGDLEPFMPLSTSIFKAFQVGGIPSYYLLNKNGEIIAKMRPKWRDPKLHGTLQKILADQKG